MTREDEDTWQCFFCGCFYPRSELGQTYEIRMALAHSPTDARWMRIGYACEKCWFEMMMGGEKA